MSSERPIVAAVIVAAGKGTRAGGEIAKQWQKVAGRRVVDWTCDVFLRHGAVTKVILVVPEDTPEEWIPLNVAAVVGGDSRDASVRRGLVLEGHCDRVLIHDGARPLVSHAVIDRVLAALDQFEGAAPGIAVSDTLWQGDETVTGVQERAGLTRAQTPQGFHFSAILDAHRALSGPATDDVGVARAAGLEVAIVEGSEDNIKITTPGDFARAERLLQKETAMDIRLGNGFDVHRFGPGDHVVLCGVEVPHGRGLQGHSDADVGLHTITDAIYGALAQGDIGQHFPPSDPQWKGAASHIFLEHARDLAGEMGFAISNVDCTLICEEPKIGPHAHTMRAKVAELLQLDMDRVSVKATTSEQLGFTGRREGIACMATATLVKS